MFLRGVNADMIKNVILFGDEEGINVLKKIGEYDFIKVVGVVYSEKRERAKGVALSVSQMLKCKVIEHPKVQEGDRYAAMLKEIYALNAAMGLCYSYDVIIKNDLLKLFADGVYNLHGALLPKYRGANTLNWVLIRGEKETGMTLHKMNDVVDGGEIVLQKRVEIEFIDTAVTLKQKLSHAAEELLNAFMQEIKSDCITFHAQDETQATYVKRRKPEDGEFSWEQDSVEIYNLIRALITPWPGARYKEGEEIHVISEFIPFDEVERLKEGYLNRKLEEI